LKYNACIATLLFSTWRLFFDNLHHSFIYVCSLFIFKPFAWDSREFLRKETIGKQVVYTVEYRTPQDKEYGTVSLLAKDGSQINIAKKIVGKYQHEKKIYFNTFFYFLSFIKFYIIIEEGWATVRQPTTIGKDQQVRP
jgi:hypothetical protein